MSMPHVVKKNFRLLRRILYFALAIGIVLIFIPQKGRFKYEFQKGKPWMHDDLYAPFDFPIYKTDAELFSERAEILKNFSPFYRFDSTVAQEAIQQFRVDFHETWVKFIAENNGVQPLSLSKVNELSTFYENEAINAIQHVMDSGILNKTENLVSNDMANSKLTILAGNVARETLYENVFTKRKALEYVKNKLQQATPPGRTPVGNIWAYMDLQKYIQPNLMYDDFITQKYKNEQIASISLTKGMIQVGERIISKGELITSSIYQVLESLKKEYEIHLGSRNSAIVTAGNALMVTALFIILYMFILSFRPEVFRNDAKILFILMLITLMAVISIYIIKSSLFSIYIVPLVIVPIYILTFFDSRLALFTHLVTIFLVGFFVPNSFEFVFINFIAGMVAIISMTNFYRRGRLFVTVGMVYATYALLLVGLAAVEEGNIKDFESINLLWFAINALLLLALYQLVYLFERIFGFLSDATLIELSDTNLDLLRKLAEVAPGTFQHSLQVANLAETAIQHVGGNPLLVRAGALYHDIGKMANPLYFIENQPYDFNPHRNLDFTESASIIINHVTEGVRIGRKAGLPDQLIDFIQTHHGTSKVRYFYQRHLDKFDNGAADAIKFTYPGPIPPSKETAILMMADAVEAASRSMKNVTEENIKELVDTLINQQLADGQFNDANITFKDISTIKSVFKKKLLNIYHARIEYPETKANE